MRNDRYWIWLQNVLGPNAEIKQLVDLFGSAADIYNSVLSEKFFFIEAQSLSNNIKDKLLKIKDYPVESCDETILYCKNHNIGILTPDDDEYPDSLRKIKTMPSVLYYRGNIDLLSDCKKVAVVGTREPDEFGKKYACEASFNLGVNGICTVSGGAVGVDSLVHKVSVANDFPTIMVLGTGIDSNYPPANALLREHVFSAGLVISEYKPTSEGTLYTFPQRNRILAALSDALIAVQAGEKSGTINACKHARSFSKLIYAYNDVSENFKGNGIIIQDGACPIDNVDPVMKNLGCSFAPSVELSAEEIEVYAEMYTIAGLKKASTKKKKTQPAPQQNTRKFSEEDFSENAVSVYYSIKNGNITLDEIILETKLNTAMVMRAISELQFEEVIEKINDSEYKILY